MTSPITKSSSRGTSGNKIGAHELMTRRYKGPEDNTFLVASAGTTDNTTFANYYNAAVLQ